MGKRGGLTAIIPVSPGAADTQCLRLVNQVVAVVASEAQVWIADPCIASPSDLLQRAEVYLHQIRIAGNDETEVDCGNDSVSAGHTDSLTHSRNLRGTMPHSTGRVVALSPTTLRLRR